MEPTIDHLKVFGCVAYAHILDQKRTKLDDKGEKCIFLGVSEQLKAYKLYNPNTKKIIISHDVAFDEKQLWEKSSEAIEQIFADLDEEKIDDEQQLEENLQQIVPVTNHEEDRP